MKAAAKETVLMENEAFRLTTQRLVQTNGLEAEITGEGHLHITAHGQERTVEIPKKLSEKQKRMLREFDETVNGSQYEKKKSFFDRVKDAFS